MVEFFYYVRSLEMKKPNKLGKVKKGISDLLVKKETYENKLIQLKNQGKKLEKMASIEERKKRTHRLIERGAILESFIEDASELSGAEIKAILEKVFSKNSVSYFCKNFSKRAYKSSSGSFLIYSPFIQSSLMGSSTAPAL